MNWNWDAILVWSFWIVVGYLIWTANNQMWKQLHVITVLKRRYKESKIISSIDADRIISRSSMIAALWMISLAIFAAGTMLTAAINHAR